MPDWDPEDIKAAVRKKGVTLADVARSAGVRANALRLALTLPREEAEGLIAGVLDLHPQTIWPSRYHSDGSRKRPQPVDNYRSDARFGKPDRLATLMQKHQQASRRGTVARG